jgi:hypothetical protein
LGQQQFTQATHEAVHSINHERDLLFEGVERATAQVNAEHATALRDLKAAQDKFDWLAKQIAKAEKRLADLEARVA